MRDVLLRTLLIGAAIALAACAGNNAVPSVPNSPASNLPAAGPQTMPAAAGGKWEHVCGPAGPGEFRCHALVRTDLHPDANPHPSGILGFKPADLQDAYKLTSASSSN